MPLNENNTYKMQKFREKDSRVTVEHLGEISRIQLDCSYTVTSYSQHLPKVITCPQSKKINQFHKSLKKKEKCHFRLD